jgi:branched-subunit amino acid aminotransferase/4-amino-4-deoxychorismate lyase
VTELVGRVQERHASLLEVRELPFFLVNSVRGIVPVGSLDGQPVPHSWETDALARRFWP